MGHSPIQVAKPDLTEEEVEAAAKVIRSGWLTQGPVVNEFESSLAAHLGAKKAICVSSCTTGLFLALKALGVGHGDEVIVPSYSFIATANSVAHAGAIPIFADVSPGDFNLNIQSVRAAIGPKTKGILLVHQAGMPADIEPFQSLAREKGLFLLEDAACAIGSTYKGRPIGSHSDFVVFSFHPRKILTTGEGGAILCNGSDQNAIQFLDLGRRHGMSASDLERHQSSKIVFESYPFIGFNYRLTDIQAAIGLVQLRRLDSMLTRRRSHALYYQRAFSSIKGLSYPKDPAYGKTNFQTFLLTVGSDCSTSALELMERLHELGIATRRGIMSAHEEPCYLRWPETRRVPLPVTEMAVRQNIVLPLYSEMEESDCDRVIESIIEILR